MIRFAFYGRVSTEDQQDPAASRSWQLERSRQLIEGHGTIIEDYFDVGHSRSLPWKRRPEASRLLQAFSDPARRFDAVVIGEPQRAFYGHQFGLTFPVFTHYRVALWVPEVGGAVDPGSEAHDLVMTLFGGMSKGERMRIKTRVKAAMTAQAATEGRFLGGRPPYGYQLEDIGPHPHPEKAALGVQLHRLSPHPETAPVVRRIFADYLTGKGYYAIAEALTADGIPSPSGHDRARNSHRLGVAWGKSAVRAILMNPRYTGYQVWGRQRRDEVLVDVDDVASGHESVMRWNDEAAWTWSAEPAHEPLVSRHDFEAVQEIMRSNTRRRGPRTRTAPTRPYALRGKLTCGICGRLMQAHQARGTHYYRCRYATEYAESTELAHPLNVYLREDDILPQLDAWLDDLFAPDRIDDTIDRILDPEPDTEATRLRARLEHELRQCDKQIAKCRALLDDDVDLATVSGWLKEAIANRQIAERRLDELRRETNSTLADRDVVREALTEIGGLTGLLASGDLAERARFYDAVGISGTYEPQVNRLILTTRPVGHMVRVGGGT